MQRAKVCVSSVNVSGENHLRLVKVEDMLPEIADHETAYLDNTGMRIFGCSFTLSHHTWLQGRTCSWSGHWISTPCNKASLCHCHQVKPMSCPKRTGGSCCWAVCWHCVRCSVMKRRRCLWIRPWSSTHSMTTSPGGKNWSSLACLPQSWTTTITRPITTSGRLICMWPRIKSMPKL